MSERRFTLRHLQKHLPWTLPYSGAFMASQAKEGHRNLAHDVMHVVKSLGKIAAVCEDIDHGRAATARYSHEDFADAVADLVICALHMAKVSPLGAFDLESVAVAKMEGRNKVVIPPEAAERALPLLVEALRPLAAIFDAIEAKAGPLADAMPDGGIVQLTFGDCRRAATALAAYEGKGE